jgi:hypothetical protein
VIRRALQVTSGQRRTDLVARLRSTPFLSARTADHSAIGRRTPAECYWPNDDLEHQLAACPDAWFLDERYAEHRRDLSELGVADHVRVRARRGDSLGHIVLRDWHSDHSRGLNGFDPDLRIAGLDEALANPDPRRSAYVWDRLLAPRADRLRGTVEWAPRQDYTNSRRRDQDTEPHRLATDRAWLPTPDGGYAAPRQLRLDDLPPDFVRHNGLADALGMITSAVQQASAELGIPVDLLRYLADNPDALAEITRAAGKASGASTVAPLNTPQAQTPPLDFTTKLQDAFTKPADTRLTGHDDGVHHGSEVRAADTRRQRTAAAINEALAAEPDPRDRFRFLPRKTWDAKNPAIRQFLLGQYAGRCQTCQATFPKRDGGPYFEIVYLVSHTSAAWIDRPATSCACAPPARRNSSTAKSTPTTCSTKSAHGGPGPKAAKLAALHLTLCGEPRTITYTEKHLLDLQTMVTHATPSDDDR